MSYSCDVESCDEKFYTFHSFKKHILDCHKPFMCHCGKYFGSQSGLDKHIKSFIFHCSQCNRELSWYPHSSLNEWKKGKCSDVLETTSSCKLCDVCDVYTIEHDQHIHNVTCKICGVEYISKPNSNNPHRCTYHCNKCKDTMHFRNQKTNHKCFKCKGCGVYLSDERMKTHACKYMCTYCGSSIKCLYGYWEQHQCNENTIRLYKLEKELDIVKSNVNEILNILKFGPLSQIALDTIDECKQISENTKE